MIYKHLAGLQINATFSDCGNFRYRLIIKHPEKKQGKVICVIMQNPSDANTELADKSVQFLENLVFSCNYREFEEVTELIIVNQFAYIQKKDFVGTEENIGPDNEAYLRDSIHKADIVLVAWGKNNRYLERQESILNVIRSAGMKHLYKTKKHPSRGCYTDFVVPLELSQPTST